MTDTATTQSVAEQEKALRERGVRKAYATVGEWDLWVQNFPASHGYAATCGIDAKIKANGALCRASMNLPLEVVFRLGELITELRSKIEASDGEPVA